MIEAGQRDSTEHFLRQLLWLSIILITVGAFEALALTTVMPAVADDLNGHRLYALAMGVPLATHVISTTFGGAWVDARGAYVPIITGCTVAALGLVIAGSAQHMEIVAIGRAVMGLGTGLLMVSLYAVVGSHVPTNRQPMFFAAFAAAWVVPSMFGPFFAGWIAERYSWRIVFVAVVPILAIAVLAMIPVLRPLPRGTANIWQDRDTYRNVAIAVGAGTGAAAMHVVVSQPSGLALAAFVVLGAGVLALLRFLLPAGTLSARRETVGAVIATRMWVNAGVVATEAFLPLMLVTIHGWEKKQAGIILTIGGISWAIGSVIQGKVTAPRVRHRLPVLGSALATAGIAITAVSALPQAPALLTSLAWLLAGSGIGLTLPAMSVLALNVTPQAEHGRISACLQIVDGIGAALAIGVVGFFTILPDVFGGLSATGGTNPFVFGLAFMAGLGALSTWTAARVPHVTGPAVSAAAV
ncbi:MAG: MFS transporter [Bowdeniella nasicola]|nr:MFS transporter [Bowdeniella nasicola]